VRLREHGDGVGGIRVRQALILHGAKKLGHQCPSLPWQVRLFRVHGDDRPHRVWLVGKKHCEDCFPHGFYATRTITS
jgi:hypothetical protein